MILFTLHLSFVLETVIPSRSTHSVCGPFVSWLLVPQMLISSPLQNHLLHSFLTPLYFLLEVSWFNFPGIVFYISVLNSGWSNLLGLSSAFLLSVWSLSYCLFASCVSLFWGARVLLFPSCKVFLVLIHPHDSIVPQGDISSI